MEEVVIVIKAIGTILATCSACGFFGKLFIRRMGKKREGHYCPNCNVTREYKVK